MKSGENTNGSKVSAAAVMQQLRAALQNSRQQYNRLYVRTGPGTEMFATEDGKKVVMVAPGGEEKDGKHILKLNREDGEIVAYLLREGQHLFVITAEEGTSPLRSSEVKEWGDKGGITWRRHAFKGNGADISSTGTAERHDGPEPPPSWFPM